MSETTVQLVALRDHIYRHVYFHMWNLKSGYLKAICTCIRHTSP